MSQGDASNVRSRLLLQALIVALLPAMAGAGPVNINSADAATLAKELEGIGQRTLEMNRENIRVERSGASAAAPAAKPKPKPGG